METHEHEATDGQGAGIADDVVDIDEARSFPGLAAGEPEPGKQLAALSREQFVERAKEYRKKPTVERVELPWLEPGAFAFVRGLTSSERDDFEASLVVTDAKGDDKISALNIRAKFLLRTLCTAEGTRLFADHEESLLSGLDAKTADALYERGRNLSGVTKADIEEMAKNSSRARSAAT